MLVIGVGNELRGDDGVGVRVARRLRRAALEGVRIIEVPDPVELIDTWAGAEDVIVVDAMRTGAHAGSIAEAHVGVDSGPGAAPPPAVHSSHGFGVAAAIALARALGRLPPRLVVYGIEAVTFAHGAPMSPRVAAAADALADRLADAFRASPPPPG
jgi:hydrogenase maturation protease